MKKLLLIFVVGLLLLSSIGAGTYLKKIEPNSRLERYSDSLLFSEPILNENEEDYVFIDLKESNANLAVKSEPILPIFIKKFMFPIGTEIRDIRVTFSEINEYRLSKKIAPAPSPVTAVNGELPVNCSGGVNSTNAIGASAMERPAEAALQIMGKASNQVPKTVHTAIGSGWGGSLNLITLMAMADEPARKFK